MKHQLTQSDFPPNTRVRYAPDQRYLLLASLGVTDFYVHLNANRYVTGRVLYNMPNHMSEYVTILPDGWPLPPGVQPQGFTAPINDLVVWPAHATAFPCVVTNGVGVPWSSDEIRRMLQERWPNLTHYIR